MPTHNTFLIFTMMACLCGQLFAQDNSTDEPPELAVIKNYVGVWDAEIEVWPQGPDAPSTKFKGVETNRPFGKHWIASDFDSEFMGQTMSVHSIVGYDLDKKSLVGTIVDSGPYAATMTGKLDKEAKSVTWSTNGKTPTGDPIVQETVIRQESEDERVLILSTPGKPKEKFSKFMQIKFVRRKTGNASSK